MLIDLNATPLISGRHSGGGSETTMLLLPPGSPGGPPRQFQNPAEGQELVQEQEENPEHQPGIVPSSMEHQIQARLLVVDKRLHQAMYNTI